MYWEKHATTRSGSTDGCSSARGEVEQVATLLPLVEGPKLRAEQLSEDPPAFTGPRVRRTGPEKGGARAPLS